MFIHVASMLFLFFHQVDEAQSKKFDELVISAFREIHQGFSSDEVILNDDLNQDFIAACQSRDKNANVLQCNWRLINLRKAGKLSGIETTRQNRVSTEDYHVVAEVVSRSILDQAKMSIDKILADPKWRQKLDDATKELDSDADLYLVRKAIFKLRKSRRLRPELITRIADWGREISKFSVAELKKDSNCAPELPGIYIFHDQSGYLYIGHSDNIRKRLASHIDKSSNLELAKYLSNPEPNKTFVEVHSFAEDSRMKEIRIRRAYESELIRNRKPRFNILP